MFRISRKPRTNAKSVAIVPTVQSATTGACDFDICASARKVSPSRASANVTRTVAKIVELTGLSRHQARLAEAREFTEPFLLAEASQLPDLRRAAASEALAITSGGRFHHLMGAGQDKGKAVDLVKEIFRHGWGEDPVTIGLGDSLNDHAMLERVDYPVVVPGVSSELADLMGSRAIHARHPGCRGWNTSVLALLERVYS